MPVYSLNCVECGSGIGYSMYPFTSKALETEAYCASCMENLCQMARAFAVPHLGTLQELADLRVAKLEDSNVERDKWRIKCQDFAIRAYYLQLANKGM